MKSAFKLGGGFVAVVAVCANALFAQAQTQAPSMTAGDCAELAEAKARLEAQQKRLNDWPDLARYRDANAKVAAAAEGEQRVGVMGDSITDMWVLPRFGGFFSGKPYIGRGIRRQTTPQMVLRLLPEPSSLPPT